MDYTVSDSFLNKWKKKKDEEEKLTPADYGVSQQKSQVDYSVSDKFIDSWKNGTRYKTDLEEKQEEKRKKAQGLKTLQSYLAPDTSDPMWYAKQSTIPTYVSGSIGEGINFRNVARTILGVEYLDGEVNPNELLHAIKGREDSEKDRAKSIEYHSQYDQLLIAAQADLLANTKMDGQKHSVLEEMQLLTDLSGSEKKKRKNAVLKKMKELGIDADNYALFTDDSNFSWDNTAKALGMGVIAGISSAEAGLTNTLDVILGTPLKALGWENNPVTKLNDYYQGIAASQAYNADLWKDRVGGGKVWEFTTDTAKVVGSALPHAIMALMTMGVSTTTSTASLANQAAYQSGDFLTKAGITTASMAKNPQLWMSFATTLGNDYEEAKKNGASDTVAAVGATVTSLLNAGIEIGFDGGSGIQGLVDDLAKGNKKKIWAWVESALEEGGEEGLQKFVGEIVTKMMYDHDADILNMGEYAKEMALGTSAGAILGSVQTAVQSGVNAYNQYQANKLTEDEQTVVDKVAESLIAQEQEKTGKELSNAEKKKITKTARMLVEKGYVKAETIESILGGESYEAFKGEMDTFFGSDTYKAWQDAKSNEESLPELQKEYDTLHAMRRGDMTGQQIDREAELKEQIEAIKNAPKSADLKAQLDASDSIVKLRELQAKLRNEVYARVKGSRLTESYRELYRRGEKFTADVSKYESESAKQTVQNILDSGLGDGTNQFRDTVELMARISADHNEVIFSLTDTDGIKEAGHYKAGYVTNGYVTDDGKITLNYDSPNMLESIVGHEITHVLEKAGHYKALRQAIFDYAISKEGLDKFNARLKEAEEAYRGKKNTSPEGEVAADLIGEYLFTDYNFIANLAKTDMNGFQRMWNEVKYMFKIAVTGSKEARQLEKVKHMFEKAYNENLKGKARTEAETKVTEETEVTEEAQLSIRKDVVDVKGTEYDSVVELDKSVSQRVLSEPKRLLNYITRNFVGLQIPVLDENGNTEIIEFAGEKETTAKKGKNGGRNPVLGELAHTKGDTRKLVVVNAIEVIQESVYDPDHSSTESEHGWLDENGWESRKTYVLAPDGKIYEAYLRIAKARDGRNILYGVNLDINNGIAVDESATQKRAAVIAAMPSDGTVAQNKPVVNDQLSLTKDSDGNQLTKAQEEFFKDSKMRDADGNLKPMYHGTTRGGFHTFDHGYSDDDLSFFFVDDNDVASSYSGTYEVYEAKTMHSAEDMNRFLASIGQAEDYQVVEENGKFILKYFGDEVASSDTAKGIYEEFCDYEGVGNGDVNYKVYLNLKNPLVIDAEGRDWHSLPSVNGDKSGYEYIKVIEVGDGIGDVTIEYAMYGDPAPVRETVDLYERFDDGLADTLSNLAPGEKVEGVYANPSTTRDYAKYAKENGYDGVIFENIYDIGGYGNNGASEATVAIAFDSTQIKSTANENPTADPDIRYSYSSIANSFFGDESMSTKEFLEADYTKTQGYQDYVEQCLNNFRQSRGTGFDEVAARMSIENSIRGIVDVAIASKQAGYDIFDDAKKRTTQDSKKRLLFSSLEPNSDYFTSNDISTICDKRQNFAEIYDEIVRQEEAKGVPNGKRFFDNINNYFAIHKIMAEKGLTTPCRQCYVESMRKNLAPMASAFMRLVGETNPDNTANDQLYHQTGKNKGNLKVNNASLREAVLSIFEANPQYPIRLEDLTIEMLTTEEGLARLRLQAPLVYEAFNSFYGQAKPKMPKSATPFRFGELTALLTNDKGEINQRLVDLINSTGGFRLQSYSDFQIKNYVDVLQVLFEAGTLGLNGHAYTKVPAFLDATEGTNLKRNISIFMYKDGDEWKLDRNDSFPYSLDEIYELVKGDETGNTSIIAVSQNKEMSAWIMANDYVGYGIPFHKSGLKMSTVRDTVVYDEDGRAVKGYTGTIDHTKQQTEVWKDTVYDENGDIVHKKETKVKKGINIYALWDFENRSNLPKNELIKKNLMAYIDACEDAGYLPKFRDYVMNNDKVLRDVLKYSKELGFMGEDATIDDISFEYKGYRIPYGYYKFLGDFGMFTPDGKAAPQKTLSLESYDFEKAKEFFSDAESLRRNEILQQFANGTVRDGFRESDMETEDLEKLVKQKRSEVASEALGGKRSLTKETDNAHPYGYYPTKDNRVYNPLDEFAPVRQDVAPKTDVAPAPVATEEMFPDEPVSIEQLYDRQDEIKNLLYSALDTGNESLINELSIEYETIREQIAELEADEADRFDSIEDTDAPPENDVAPFERADVVPLTKKVAQDIARDVRQKLGLSNKQMYDVHMLIKEYSKSEFPDREQLFLDIKEKFGTYTESEYDETVKEAKSYLRTYGLFVSDSIKKEIADYAHLMRKNRGRIRFSKEGTAVDVLYHEMNELFPHLFPEEIIAPTDQFMQMVEVANLDAESKVEQQLPDEAIWDVANALADSVAEYQQTQREKAANKYGREAFNSLMQDADQYAPPVEDIAPVATEPVRDEIAPTTENVAPQANSAPSETGEPRTATERLAKKLENYNNELARNQQLREESNKDYDNEIARLQAEYDAKKNKRSMSAHDLLRRIEKLKRMKNNVDADYAKRINDIGKRIEKLSQPEAKTAAQRQTKMEEHTEKWRNLIGDTSTWKDMALGLSYKIKTLRRILRKVVRGADGKPDIGLADQIYDELETKYDHNEALLKRESARVKAVFEKLNLNHHEDTYAHMLGELRHNPDSELTQDVVDAFYKKHKKHIDTKKVDTAIAEARKTFDDLLVRVNTALREQGFKEIPYRQGYFPHFTNPKQGWLAKLLNWKTIDTEVPTSIAGLTEQFKPQRSWQSFNKERKGDTTDYSLYQGLDTYIHGALDWIYHIDDLQSRRSLENYLRYIHSEEGVKARIDEIKANEEYDADEAQELIDGILKEANNPLSGLVRELMNRTNTLANKKAAGDRKMEDDTNRKVYSVMTNLNNRINANMVVGSISSALTNFIPMVQSWHQVSPYFTVRGLGDYIRSVVRDDGMIERSDFLTNRLMDEEKLYQTGWDKISDKAAWLMNIADRITTNTVWRSKYLQNIKEGMSEAEAIKDADQFAKNLMAGRSRGNAPTIFDEKNPATKLFTAFQLEVANQYGYMFEDVPKDSKNMARLVKGYATALVGAYVYNALYSSLVGRDAAFDPIKIIEELFKDLSDDDEEPEDIALNLVDNVLEEVPFVGGLVGGGRIPISSALPYEGDYKTFISDAFNGEIKAKEMLKPLYYLAMPVGGGQIKKTFEGLSMFDDDLPVTGSYTDSGSLRFPVDKTLGNVVQAGMFGQYASKNARYYFDNDIAPLAPKQIQEYKDVDIPIRDYWDYRKGLSGLKTAQEKADYINGLNLPIRKKNILINNQLDRKEPIDMRDYDDYGSLEEFDFAQKNPEKYDFFSSIGVGYQDYKNANEEEKDVYNWAFDNPEKYALSKAVTNDLFEYKKYTSDLGEIRADKDANGKSISGSAKEKKKKYIFSLDIDMGAKFIMYKDAYPSVDDYNDEIIEYLNFREDLTYDDRIAILKELGFTVRNGRVYYD